MKIVDVCAFYSPRGGGVKTYVEQKLEAGPAMDHEIVVIAPGDSYEVIERGPKARIITLPSPRLPVDRKYWYFRDQAALHAVLDAEAPDFVEASSPWRSPSMVASWRGDVPRSLIMHADPLSAYAYRWLGPLMARETIDRRFEPFWAHLRTLSRSYDRVVCASRELRERLAAGGVLNTALHPMGIEPGLFSPERRDPAVRARLLELCGLPEGAQLLIGVGRLAAEKRWPFVIDAVSAAGRTMPIGFVLFGEGTHRARVVRQIGGNPHIRLVSPVRDRQAFATILSSADAMVHGGAAETFCMAAAEARASGVPLIVPDRGAVADHAADGAGVTYRADDALSAAASIRYVLRKARPSTAPRVVTREDHFAALFADYESLVEGSRKAA